MRRNLFFTLLLVISLFVLSVSCFADIVWERIYEAQVDGSTMAGAYTGGFQSVKPVFVDIDNDGDEDMFIGEYDGNINYYENTGTANSPSWTLVTETYESIDVGGYSAPTFVDIDNDDDYDMFIGGSGDNINYYRNDGTADSPSWTFVTGTHESIDVGLHSAPTFVDIDNDGDYDMFIGEFFGNINYYRNDGTADTPSWTLVTETYESIDVGGRSTPTFVDIDNDGDYDMFIGETDGNINYYENTGTADSPSWTLVTETYESIDVGSSSTPTFVDIDNDADYDMFIGEFYSHIDYYENTGTADSPSWTLVTETYESIDIGSVSHPAFVDIDNDGDEDMFIGDSNGNINYYRNDGTAASPSWTFVTANYESIGVGSQSSPTFADIDNDGDEDMFIGNSNGNINYYRNDGTAANPSWTFVTSTYESIDVGWYSTPTFVDIDNDGDKDMFIGEYWDGDISYYRNDGTAASASWTFVTANYASTNVGSFSYCTPTFVDIDNDGDEDMFIGKANGNISYYRNDGTAANPSWTFVTSTYESIDVGSSSNPTFVDIDNDGDKDMFIGESYGGINHWRATPIYIISGTITDGVNPISNVTINLTGDSSATTITDGSGNYFFAGLDAGSTFTVTPSAIHYDFNPTSTTYTDLTTDQTSTDFIGTIHTWDISGTVTDGTDPMVGVTVNLTGDSTVSTVTDGSGNYAFNGLDAGGTYIVTPTLTHYTFTPTATTYNDLSADLTATDFIGVFNTWGISGTITDDTDPLVGVTVNLTGDSTTSTVTDGSGNYAFNGLDAGGTYTITPSLTHYTFTPPSTAYIDLSADQTSTDFVGILNTWDISGTITDGINPLLDVAVNLSGDSTASTVTDGSGNYAFNGLDAGGTYIVTPTLTHYTFNPVETTHNDLSADQTSTDFVGILNTWDISGTITDGTDPLVGVTVNLTVDSTASTITDASGNYAFNNLDAGSTYVITPSKTHYTFTPVDRIYTDLSGDVADADFVASWNQWVISGTITDGANPMVDVAVSLSGDSTASTITDGSGYYTFDNLDAGATYVVAASMKYWLFAPESTTYIDLDGAKTQDFTGTKDFAANLEDVIVYPNPFKQDNGTDVITFANLTENAKIQIYTISGKLFFEADADSIEYQWDLKNDQGEDIACGIYICYIFNDEGEKAVLKVAVIQ